MDNETKNSKVERYEEYLTEVVSAKRPLLDDEESILERHQKQRRLEIRRSWTYIAVCLLSTILIIAFGGASFSTLHRMSRASTILEKTPDFKETHHQPLCSKPRIRKEWRSLSRQEQQDYIKAVQCFAKIPSQTVPNGTLHDEFAHAHMVESETSHKSASFLPWHRYFLHVYERTLQNRCHYKGMIPYWDWTQDWEDPLQSSIWDPETGFGGNGNTSTPKTVGYGHCVDDGPFAGLQVKYYGDDDAPHCLSRGFIPLRVRPYFGAQVVNASAMATIFDTDDFYKFTSRLEAGPHLSIPRLVQGDWRRHTAPNDPLFYLHHAQLDRLWWKWQLQDIGNRVMAYNGPAHTNSTAEAKLTDKLDLQLMITKKIAVPKVPVEKVMIPDEGFMCYDYAEPL